MKAAPTIHLRHGKAWRLDLEAITRRTGRRDAGVDVWLVEAEWAHPVWHSYLISLIHLRPTPGLLLPKIYVPCATHELVLYALQPDGDRDRVLVDGLGSWCKCMSPVNFCAQIVEVTDDLARQRIREAVELICQGSLSPDTDYLGQWCVMFGDGMVKRGAR
jgi:hypothetical protein